MVVSLRYLLPFLLLAACAGATPSTGTTVSTAERDAPLQATEGAIGGLVFDSADGLPLSMVMLQAELDGKIVAEDVSNYKGKYRVGPLPPGHYRVTARFAGARVVYEGVVVHAKNETKVRVDIDLRPQGDRSTRVQSEGSLGTIKGVVLDRADGKFFPGTAVALHASHLSEAVMAIADEAGSLLMADIAHIAGLVASDLHPSPVPHCHFVTTTTHKTLRGPRGGMILCTEEWAAAIDKAVFPGV